MQHRAGESTGVAISQPNPQFIIFRKNGTVHTLYDDVFSGNHSYPKCRSGIGHGRYSTIGKSDKKNMQPVKVGNVAIGHNGTLVNYEELRESYGKHLETELDSEVIAYILHDSNDFLKGAKRCADECEGAYNFVAVNNKGELSAFRDPHGFHPLFVGRKDDSYYIASEDIALTKFGIYNSKEMDPGEIFIFSNDGSVSHEHLPRKNLAMCSFELFYFLSHGSSFNGHVAKDVRKKAGNMLAEKYPVDADVVIPNPDSGINYGLGYSEVSRIPFDFSLVKTDVGRTYTHPDGNQPDMPEELQMSRAEKTKRKLAPIVSDIKGKKIIITDDSIVRLVNASTLTKMLYDAGAEKVHWRVGYAPIRYPCFFGLRHSTRKELVAAGYEKKKDIEECIESLTGATTVRFLDTDDNMKILGDKGDYCFACQTGNYPCDIPKTPAYEKAFELK